LTIYRPIIIHVVDIVCDPFCLKLQREVDLITTSNNRALLTIKKQDKGAFKKMYLECIGYVYSIVIRYVSNESDHKDVIQEIFARLFLSIGSYDPSIGGFKPWLRRLVINQCFQHNRQARLPAMMVPLDQTEESDTELEEKLGKLTKKNIENLLNQMPEGYRQVFMMVAIDDYSHKEVGEMIGISTGTSRSQYARAKQWLKSNLTQNKLNRLANGIWI
jgi:RNA polymerase sigma-70 factor (ECF subfamily)